MAGWRGDVRVYVLARGASSGADSDAGASVGVSDSTKGVGTDLAMELVVEASWIEDETSVGGNVGGVARSRVRAQDAGAMYMF